MDWWSELWLNEGFAKFMEYLCSESIVPEWKMWDMFLTFEFERAFDLDAMVTSHPIQVPVRSSAQVDEIFDAISYCKGASVIRMIESFLGGETFRLALKNYLLDFQYRNAVTTNLWDHLSRQSGKDVASIMSTWTDRQGFPLVRVTREGNQLKLSQKRFIASGAMDEVCDREKNF